MPGIRVVTDSAADLPQKVVTELGIAVVPLTIRFGETELVDGKDLTPGEFWDRCKRSPVLPETAAPSPGAFEQTFRSLADEGAEGIVCINLSSEMSATLQAAEMASKAVADTIPVRVVDSKSVSLGEGQLVIAAAKMANEGKGLEDVAGAAEDLIPRTRLFATLDTLENLKKGGRIGGAQAFIGTLLSFKPVIKVEDGKVEQEARPRTRSRSLRYLVDKAKELSPVEHMAVVHAAAPDVEEFLDMVGELVPRDEILVGNVGAVIGTHSGPGAIGITFHVGR